MEEVERPLPPGRERPTSGSTLAGSAFAVESPSIATEINFPKRRLKRWPWAQLNEGRGQSGSHQRAQQIYLIF